MLTKKQMVCLKAAVKKHNLLKGRGYHLHIKGMKLVHRSGELKTKSDITDSAKMSKLLAEGKILSNEGVGLYAVADKLWAEAVLKHVGNVVLDWRDFPACWVEGVRFALKTPTPKPEGLPSSWRPIEEK